MAAGQPVFLVAQREITVAEPEEQDLYTMGTVSIVRQILRCPETTVRVMVEGQQPGATAPPVADRALFAGQGGAIPEEAPDRHLPDGGPAAADL